MAASSGMQDTWKAKSMNVRDTRAAGPPWRRRASWVSLGIAVGMLGVGVVVGTLWWGGAEVGPSVAPPASGLPWYSDVAAESGLHVTCRNGAEAGHLTLLES